MSIPAVRWRALALAAAERHRLARNGGIDPAARLIIAELDQMPQSLRAAPYFDLALHENKTRLVVFGQLPAMTRQQRGERRSETFAFLGFTIIAGRFMVKHKTQRQRLTRKLKALRPEAWQLIIPAARLARERVHLQPVPPPYGWRTVRALKPGPIPGPILARMLTACPLRRIAAYAP